MAHYIQNCILFTILAQLMPLKGVPPRLEKPQHKLTFKMRHLVVKFQTKNLTYLWILITDGKPLSLILPKLSSKNRYFGNLFSELKIV